MAAMRALQTLTMAAIAAGLLWLPVAGVLAVLAYALDLPLAATLALGAALTFAGALVYAVFAMPR
jgi:hypothetical protein